MPKGSAKHLKVLLNSWEHVLLELKHRTEGKTKMRNSTLYDQIQCEKNEHVFVPKMSHKVHLSFKEDEQDLMQKEQRVMKHFGLGRSASYKRMLKIVDELIFPQPKQKI